MAKIKKKASNNNNALFRGSSWKRRKQIRTDGFRSKFEKDLSQFLETNDISFTYEEDKIKYTKPVSKHVYTPDFYIEDGDYYIEAKGLFNAQDRKKHLLIKEQGGPEIRFVFYNANAKLSKVSKTTYAMWCDKNGFKWSHKVIPKEWLDG